MNAIRIDTTVDDAVVLALPALRPLLGRQVEIIALDATSDPGPGRKLTVDELLASRIELPPGTPPLSQEDIDRAIAQGAMESVRGASKGSVFTMVLPLDGG